MPIRRTRLKPKRIPVPQIQNIADLRSTPRRPCLIHFTDQQWKQATKGAKAVKALKKGQPSIMYTPLPDGGGIIMVDCAPTGPNQICGVRPVIDPPGVGPRPGPGPDPRKLRSRGFFPERWPVRWECQCRDRRGRRPPLTLPPVCELVVERSPLRIRCLNHRCNGRCTLRFVHQNGAVRIACECA